MIIKEREPSHSTDRRIQAGEKAESQMAHYLRRAFGDAPDVLVFNDLRIVRDGEAAQMDHLIVHRWGMIIIESKSVSEEIRVNDQLEFTRVYRGREEGMRSPIEQAKQQGELLRQLLQDHADELREKYAMGLLQGGFKYCPIDVYVAIADGGRIHRGTTPVPELMKADQIAGTIQNKLAPLAKLSGLGGLLRTPLTPAKDMPSWEAKRSEMGRISQFLLARHTPHALPMPSAVKPRKHDISVSEPSHPVPGMPTLIRPNNLPVFLCTYCHSEDVGVRYGFSYYLKCNACTKNTPLKLDCPNCSATATPRKRRNEFFAECEACNEWRLVFVAP